MQVVKHYESKELCEDAYNFYNQAYHYGPKNVKCDGKTLKYDFVLGSYPYDKVSMVIEALKDLHSGSPQHLEHDADRYISHVISVNSAPSIDNTIRTIEKFSKHARHVSLCHGDCTVGNTLYVKDTGIVFIDPASHRHMPCVELDESKIMQSLDGWEAVRYGLPQAIPPLSWEHRITPTPLHYALLCTHYVRMLRHQSGDAKSFALMRIRELELLCRHFV